jgi:hypothetical protein
MSEEDSEDDSMPAAMVPQYIIRDYNPTTYGATFIKEEDVVRPWNRKYSQQDRDQADNWTWRNMAARQTYGTCPQCFQGGPLYDTCNKCGYGHLYWTITFGDHELDSITLANNLERNLVFQRSDKKFVWETPHPHPMDVSDLQLGVGYMRDLTEKRRDVIFRQLMDILPYDYRAGRYRG